MTTTKSTNGALKKNFSQKIIPIIIAAVALGAAVLSFGMKFSSDDTAYAGGTAADILQTYGDLRKDIIKRYEGKNGVNLKWTEKVLDSINLKQNDMNDQYYAIKGIKYTGTCTEVALTILASNYTGKENKSFLYNTGFVKILDLAFEKKYYTPGKGTKITDMDILTKHSFDIFNIRKGKSLWNYNNNHFDVYSVIKKNVDAGNPTLFNIPEHSMVGVGYYEFEVTYTIPQSFLGLINWTKKVTERVGYIIVNDGWDTVGLTRQSSPEPQKDFAFSFFPADKISFEFFSALLRQSQFSNIEFK
ncbi:MAG: hypothetical protein LBT55_00360 [Clostridiaceae bacterium]|jgi:hypothetical protein|nr:hypothetical protein [Clostridiaceae bacterium]